MRTSVKIQMKKLMIPYILFILIATPTVLADSITIESTINESLHVTFKFAGIEPQLYSEIENQGFDISTIPNAIEGKFEQQNLANARVIYDLNQEIFNGDTHSIYVEFLLAGSDVISYTLSETDMARTFRVRTDWRKIQVSFTQNFSLNFEEHFGAPLTEWQRVNNTVFEKSIESPFEMSFRLILPEKAVDVQAGEDTIVFKVPPALEDTVLNSPFLILGAIIIASIIVVVYRKARK